MIRIRTCIRNTTGQRRGDRYVSRISMRERSSCVCLVVCRIYYCYVSQKVVHSPVYMCRETYIPQVSRALILAELTGARPRCSFALNSKREYLIGICILPDLSLTRFIMHTNHRYANYRYAVPTFFFLFFFFLLQELSQLSEAILRNC